MAAEIPPASTGLGSFLSHEQQKAFTAALDAKSAGDTQVFPKVLNRSLNRVRSICSQKLQLQRKLHVLLSQAVVESRLEEEGDLPSLRPLAMENLHGAQYFTMVRPKGFLGHLIRQIMDKSPEAFESPSICSRYDR